MGVQSFDFEGFDFTKIIEGTVKHIRCIHILTQLLIIYKFVYKRTNIGFYKVKTKIIKMSLVV